MAPTLPPARLAEIAYLLSLKHEIGVALDGIAGREGMETIVRHLEVAENIIIAKLTGDYHYGPNELFLAVCNFGKLKEMRQEAISEN
jgi:hypothetical protein